MQVKFEFGHGSMIFAELSLFELIKQEKFSVLLKDM
jgi:hypothetical protein